MNPLKSPFTPTAALTLALGLLAGCETTDGGSASVSTGVYYGVGFHDPWYYGGYYPPDVVVPPPSERPPPGSLAPHPEHPIARPPPPSIPSTPRPMPQPAMRR
jgi:hypothetical protein